jgi:hypothetical protein
MKLLKVGRGRSGCLQDGRKDLLCARLVRRVMGESVMCW